MSVASEEKYKLYKPKKFLGQNFLVDDNIARKIIKSLKLESGDNLVEIGPGHGALTKHLAALEINYTAVELDRGFAESLSEKYKDRINILHKDFLKLDFHKDLKGKIDTTKKLKIIGNIPYNITSEILFRLFDMRDELDKAVIMMQKEVARRLVSEHNTKDYGILAVNTQVFSKPGILFNVPPTAFFPKPRVDSSVILLNFNTIPNHIEEKEIFTKVLRNSFGKRRKIMSNSLKDTLEEYGVSTEDINFDFGRRPESLTPAEFILLSNEIALRRKEKTIGNKNGAA